MSRAQDEPMIPRNVSGSVPTARDDGTITTAVDSPLSRSGGSGSQPLVERVAKLVLGLLCLVGAYVLAIQMWRIIAVFPEVTAVSAVICVVTLLFGYWILRRIRPVRAPSTRASLVAVAWGVTSAAGLALLANNALSGIWAKSVGVEFAARWDAALTGPFNEELLKMVGIVLIAVAFPRVVRGPMDGFVIGSLVGVGFQVVENFLYALLSVLQSGAVDGVGAATASSGVRVLVTGLGTHWALSALTGTAVGLLAAGAWRPDARRTLTAGLLVLTAIGLHFVFNQPGLGGNGGILFRVLLNLTVVLVVYFVLRHAYRGRVLDILTREGEKLGMDSADARALARRSGRRKALRAVPAADRPRAAKRQEILVDAADDRAHRR